jgi:crotonobetainyl-CoA:carnitine CoA-transferase CaiB-like acyl-CoA transferase
LRNAFLCKDGKFVIGTHHPEPKYWPLLCDAAETPELMEDPRFATEDLRKENAPALIAIFDEVFATKTRDEWMVLFQERGMMYSPVQTSAEVPDDPQALVNGYIVPFDHPRLGKVQIPGYPAHFSACRAGTKSAAPTIGQHTDEVLRELGYGEEGIAAMRAEGIIR